MAAQRGDGQPGSARRPTGGKSRGARRSSSTAAVSCASPCTDSGAHPTQPPEGPLSIPPHPPQAAAPEAAIPTGGSAAALAAAPRCGRPRRRPPPPPAAPAAGRPPAGARRQRPRRRAAACSARPDARKRAARRRPAQRPQAASRRVEAARRRSVDWSAVVRAASGGWVVRWTRSSTWGQCSAATAPVTCMFARGLGAMERGPGRISIFRASTPVKRIQFRKRSGGWSLLRRS